MSVQDTKIFIGNSEMPMSNKINVKNDPWKKAWVQNTPTILCKKASQKLWTLSCLTNYLKGFKKISFSAQYQKPNSSSAYEFECFNLDKEKKSLRRSNETVVETVSFILKLYLKRAIISSIFRNN